MYELLYTSAATKSLSDSDLMGILEKARVKNQRIGISGILIYGYREFVQLLEGEKESVINLLRTIRTDDRHTSVEVFYEGPIDNRAFSEWSMAFKILSEDDKRNLVSGYEQLDPDDSPKNLIASNPNIGKELLLMLRDKL